MDSARVNREIKKVVRPVLNSAGFTAFTSRSGWRTRRGRIDIVNFQSFNAHLASSVGCTTYSFALNLGVYLTGLSDGADPEKPEEYLGHLRLHPHRTLDQPELARHDISYVDPGGNSLQSVVVDARDVITKVGLSWFDRWGADDAVLEALQSAAPELPDGTQLPGNSDSPARNLVTGYLARRCGMRALARDSLARALELFEEIDGKNAALRLRKPMPPVTPPGLRRDVEELARPI